MDNEYSSMHKEEKETRKIVDMIDRQIEINK